MSHIYVRISYVRSLADNNICYGGKMEGLNTLTAAIKEMPNLSSLKCASSVLPPYSPGLLGCVTAGTVTFLKPLDVLTRAHSLTAWPETTSRTSAGTCRA
jgi:hypothetical protein